MHDDKSKNIKKFSLFMGKKFDIIELNWLIISKKGGEKNMAYWNLAFDCAAIFFLLLIFVWYFIEKRIPFISHRIFLHFLALVFVSTGLEVIGAEFFLNPQNVNENIMYCVLSLQSLATHLMIVIFSVYLFSLAHVDVKRNKFLFGFYLFSVVAEVFVTVLNPILKWQFVLAENYTEMSYAGFMLYLLDAIMVVMCIATLFQSKKKVFFLRIEPMLFMILCAVVAAAIQITFHLQILNFMLAALCLTLYHYQQNSGKVLDSVTGQFNRRFLGEYLIEKFEHNKAFDVIIAAMDDFKFINRTYGVECGDYLLHEIGSYFDSIGEFAKVFRFSSDQFCVVLEPNESGIETVVNDMLERFHHPWVDANKTEIMLSASICCLECPRDARSYGELIEVIDYSMGMAKRFQKGKVTYTSDLDLDKIKYDKKLEKAVKNAIDRNEIMVYYQPIFSVEKGVYNSAEALVRIHDDEMGWISPEDFIPIAEKNGLIVQMGEVIFEKVCRFISHFRLSETSVEYIEVNISPVQIVQRNFANRAIEIMEKYRVKPEQINFEITETATMNSLASVDANIAKLVDYGVTFSLDDYGSGNANIEYINHMPFKIIKIDKYIIWDSFKNDKAGITLEYTIGMLNALKLYIVAEGVETEEMKQRLAQFGCHYMQGWLYSKAVSDVEFMKLLETA